MYPILLCIILIFLVLIYGYVFFQYKLNKDWIECLVLVTQNPDDQGLPHTSAILHNKLKLKSTCSVFDISLGCSGYVHGLSIIKSFMDLINGRAAPAVVSYKKVCLLSVADLIMSL